MSRHSLLTLIALITIFFLPSCKKAYDYIHDRTDGNESLCQVYRLKVWTIGGVDSLTVSYNAKGDPVSMLDTPSNVMHGTFDNYFRYDTHGRLTDFISTSIKSTVAQAWHRYAYTAPNFIVDTAMQFDGNDEGRTWPDAHGPAPGASSALHYNIAGYKLDSKGRIAEFWTIPNDPSQPRYLAFTYNYDGNGNLILNNPNLTYDDKVCVYRTNKVWQFLNRDYSRNNVIMADHAWPDTYNNYGLPTELENTYGGGGFYQFGVSNLDHTIVIEYC